MLTLATASLLSVSFGVASAQAQAAPPVRYAITPTIGSVKPGGYVTINLSVTTDSPIAGASVHVTYGSSAFASFQTASAPQLSFVTYHNDPGDILFICNNNRCEAGSYQIGTLSIQAGSSGTVNVSFTPKETADTQLSLIGASGASGVYSITASAPASTISKPPTSTSSVPKARTNASTPIGTTVPQIVSNDQLTNQAKNAQATNNATSYPGLTSSSGTQTKANTTTRNLLLISIGFGIGFALAVCLIWLLLRRRQPITPHSQTPTDMGSLINPDK